MKYISILILFVLSLAGCSLERRLVVRGTLNAPKTAPAKVHIKNSHSGIDTVFSLKGNEYQFKESVIDGLLVIDWFVNDSLVQSLETRNILEKNQLYVQLTDRKSAFTEMYSFSFEKQEDFTLHLDLDKLKSSEKLECKDGLFLREFEYAIYGEIMFPNSMPVSEVAQIDEMVRDSAYHTVAIMGGGTCDKQLSRMNNKYAKNAYGAEFYRRDARNVCLSKNSDYGCDTLNVATAKFGKGEWARDKWWAIYDTTQTHVNASYKVRKITRENNKWKFIE